MAERAVTIEAIEGVSLEEYITEVCKEVKCKPQNIDSISVIPGNKICIYFSNSHIANKCRSKALFKERLTGVKPKSLRTPDMKIIISNVFPMISNESIKQVLKNCGIKVSSDIQFLPVSFTNPEFAEIKSFKRQVYIKPESREFLPDMIELECMGVMYNIFFSAENEKCFFCQGVGSGIKANINSRKRKSDSTPSTAQPSTSTLSTAQPSTSTPSIVQPSTSKKSCVANPVIIKPSVSTEQRNSDSTLQPKLATKTNLSTSPNMDFYDALTAFNSRRTIEQHNSASIVPPKLATSTNDLPDLTLSVSRKFNELTVQQRLVVSFAHYLNSIINNDN